MEYSLEQTSESRSVYQKYARCKKILLYSDLRSHIWWKAWLLHAFRIIYAISKDIIDDRLGLRATSLVYTTLLSIVPTLAIVFSILKSFDFQSKLKESLLAFLSPMGERGVEITGQIMKLVEAVDAGVLGSVGLVFLIYAIISLVAKVESSINEIWGVEVHRPLVRRFSDYISAVILGPVLIMIVVGIMANFFSSTASHAIPGLGELGVIVNAALPNALIIFIFLFLYKTLPNDRVSLLSALIGAICACFLWKLSSLAFAHFVATSSRVAELYSIFATLIIFFIWLNFAWLIILIGAAIAFYHQYPLETVARRMMKGPASLDLRKMTLEILTMIAQNFEQGKRPWTAEGLALCLRAPKKIVDHILGKLERSQLIHITDTRPQGYVPARPAGNITIKEVLEASRNASQPRIEQIEIVMGKLDDAQLQAIEGEHMNILVNARQEKT